jgi:hypothetical protein
MSTESTNSHQLTSLKPTSTGMQKGAVGGRYASTLNKTLGPPELSTVIEKTYPTRTGMLNGNASVCTWSCRSAVEPAAA